MKKLYSFLLGIVVVILVLAGLSARLEAKTNPKDSDKLVIYNWGLYRSRIAQGIYQGDRHSSPIQYL